MCSSGETRASPATRSPAAIAGSRKAPAPPTPPAAEVHLDHIPEVLGEIERFAAPLTTYPAGGGSVMMKCLRIAGGISSPASRARSPISSVPPHPRLLG